MPSFPHWALAALAAAALAARPARAAIEDSAAAPPLLALGAGAAGLFDPRQDFFWTVEYRPAFRWFHLGPWLLAGTGRNQEFYAAAGILIDLPLGERWVLTPSFGGGYYHAEKGLDLGFDMQFRSSIELAWRFRGGQRIGISFAHLSNGSLGDYNPGTETLSVAMAWPLDTFWTRKQNSLDLSRP